MWVGLGYLVASSNGDADTAADCEAPWDLNEHSFARQDGYPVPFRTDPSSHTPRQVAVVEALRHAWSGYKV